ncbi:AfsR/SARP family transcriptional regulator [Planomonospora venezuelensis]|uniref:DNA-binding SARP family transcriptional activator n=2 Tax=Planomonospora venezuelensis TaxID=1999 RepID=A0A841D4H4_PLAVE|nr:BTAD domain-containing putative transcriptional regulator [Planomonospora venezuelensis]MBB5962366.1 DNA-binding SARP family transcriptional activator [Planomonospora venezuelensis]
MKATGPALRFRCLGPLSIRDGADWVTPGSAKVRHLLALLLVNAGRSVPAEVIVAELWNRDPPATHRTLVRGYVRELRRLLRDSDQDTVRHHHGGYLLRTEPGEVDAERFELLCDQACEVYGSADPESAGRLFDQALALWRGPVFAGVPPSLALLPHASALQERRLLALESRADIDLRAGRHREAVPTLRRLAGKHPLHERFTLLLMRALRDAGRRAEALDAYARLRRHTVQELGLEPGPQLQQLHTLLLAEEDAGRAPVSAPPVPAQTPPDIADFTGREKEVAQCLSVLSAADSRAPRILSVSGRAGVGKTAFAVHLAHRLREVYPDGRLYADLSAPHTTPHSVLGQFLRALGLPRAAVQGGLAERLQSYRSVLDGRRVLVIVDDARSESQVRPLVPSSPGSALLVTGRTRLLGLESAHFTDLDVLPHDAALELLAAIAGAERVGNENGAAAEIVELCGRLPLAIRIAGARAAARAAWPLSAFAAELSDGASRLDLLKAGDLDVGAAITGSYTSLDPHHRRLFRLLGLLDAPDFPLWAAAALAGLPERETGRLLSSLVDARLVDELGRSRFRLHDLVRLFARRRAEADDDAAARSAALRRVFGGLLLLAEEAGSRLGVRTLAPIRPAVSSWSPDSPELLVADSSEWFESERKTISASVRQAAATGLTELAWGLAAAAQAFYELRDVGEGADVHRIALAACRKSGDRRGEAVMLRNLADLHAGMPGAPLDDKLERAEGALSIFRDLGEREGEADALYLCGDVHRLRGDHERALRCFHESAAIAGAHGYPLGELHTLQQLAAISQARGSPDLALRYAGRALDIAQELGSSRDECVVRGLLGMTYRRRGEFTAAEEQLRRAAAKARIAADPLMEAQMLAHLGQLYAENGHIEARQTLERALSLSTVHHYDFGRAVALHGLGLLEIAEDRSPEAVGRLQAAVEIWDRLQNALGRARTLTALGEAHAGTGDRAAAHAALTAAQREYRRLGDEQEADRIGSRLSP